jgi:hypothetical protein
MVARINIIKKIKIINTFFNKKQTLRPRQSRKDLTKGQPAHD